MSGAMRFAGSGRGSAILLALFALLLLEILLAGLFWTLRVEARAGLESLAGIATEPILAVPPFCAIAFS